MIEASADIARGRSPCRKKSEFYKKFQWVIGRAINHAHHTDKSVGDIITEWESTRRQWWYVYYNDSMQQMKKIHTKPDTKYRTGIKGMMKHWKKCYSRYPEGIRRTKVKEQRKRYLSYEREKKDKPTKPRWTKWQRRNRAERIKYGLL